MGDNCFCFRTKKELFQEYAIPEMAKSPEYLDIGQELDSILLLADRILAAFQENLEFGRVWDIAKYLGNISVNINDRDALNKATEELLQSIERWFKPIISLVLPEIWRAKKDDGNYTLNPVIDDLDLLDGGELSKDIDHIHEITDPAHALFLIAYRYRNPLVHNPKDFSPYHKVRFLPAALASLLAPVYKYRREIRQKLESLITSPFESQEIKNLITLVNSERQRHLASFLGRQRWVSELKSRLETLSSKPNPYLLLVGHEGMGKSALVARITEELSSSDMIGRHAGSVRKGAPWLPNTILHFGKQSNQPQEIVHLLIAQINTFILEPMKFTTSTERKQGFSSDFRSFYEFNQNSHPKNLSENTPAFNPTDYSIEKFQQDNRYESSQTDGVDIIQLRRELYLALEMAVKERGHIVMVIDAVDEISLDGSSLQFLPEPLPVGVSALLTARPDIRVVTWLQNNREVQIIRLSELERSEIPLFTRLPDEVGEVESKFNDRVWRASKGWPLYVIASSKLVQENQSHLDSIQIDKSMDSLFERQAKEWKSSPNILTGDPLAEILMLLAVFEPVASLDLEMIQAFLERNGEQYSRERIKQLLQSISNQIEGLDVNRIKLAIKSFAEYLRERWYSRRDLKRGLSEITQWWANERDIDAKTIALYLHYWARTDRSKDQQGIANSLVDAIISRSNAELLHQIYKVLMQQTNSVLAQTPLALKCICSAAELGNKRAMLDLGSRLLDGKGIKRDPTLGRVWLEKSARENDTSAMTSLGWRLMDGKGVAKDQQSGEAWLLKAIELEDENAKLVYSNRLIDGVGLPKSPEKGERILKELSDDGNQKATFNLANRYLTGHGVVKDIETGEFLLRSLFDQNYLPACFSLAERLIDGDKITPNPQEGENILRDLVEKGEKVAVWVLSYRWMYGKGLSRNLAQAEQLLLRLANSGDNDTMLILGNMLLEGNVLPQQKDVGKLWLEKAANENHTQSMLILAMRYLEGNSLPKNQPEGKRWLVKAAETGDSRAMGILGARLFEGEGIAKNIKEGIKWLKKAAEAGDEWAMILLAKIMLRGDKTAKDLQEGETLLRKACDENSPEAWRRLGDELLDGENLPPNLIEGEAYLRRAAEHEYPNAMRDLGIRLVTGNNLTQNIPEGKMWLEKACEKKDQVAKTFVGASLIEENNNYDIDLSRGELLLREAIAENNHTQAKITLGRLLIIGNKLKKNEAEGLKLLIETSEEGNLSAMYYLAQFMLDGEYIPKNPQEGKKWLRKAAQEGDAGAMIELGQRCLDGMGLEKNIEEGRKWLSRAYDSGKADALAILGRHYYQSKNYDLASQKLLEGYQKGSAKAGNNLAFMLRRGEATLNGVAPSIKQLLQTLLEKKDIFAQVNLALATASGYETDINWAEADQLIHNILITDDLIKEIFVWWHEKLARNDDPEGHLVVGWFVRHYFATDPDGFTIKHRMDLARQGGWVIPVWMDEHAPEKEPV